MSVLRYENVKWSVPFLFNEHIFLLNLCKVFSDAETKCPIESVYGHIRNKWNGGDCSVSRNFNVGQVFQDLKYLNLESSIDFSNYHLEESHLKDNYSNQLLDYGYSHGASFIVSSDLLYGYIKKRYPNAKCIASEVKSIYELKDGCEVDYYKHLSDKYDKIILPTKYVKEKFLSDVESYENVEKFEVTVNDTCLNGCPKLIEHIETIENFELGKAKYTDYYEFCPKKDIELIDGITRTLVLSKDELDRLVNEIGITHLRIKGFTFPMESYPEILSNYMFNTFGEFQFMANEIDDCVLRAKEQRG